MRHILKLGLIASAFILGACGGGGNTPAEENPGNGSENDGGTSPPKIIIERNKPYVFYTFKVDQSYYDPVVGQVDADTQVHMAVDINRKRQELIETNRSVSYAASKQYVFTTGDELYLKEDIDPLKSTGSVLIDRFDLANQNFTNYISVSEPNATYRGCFMITDDRYYFWNQFDDALEYVNLIPGGWRYNTIYREPGVLAGTADGCYVTAKIDIYQDQLYHARFGGRESTLIYQIQDGSLVNLEVLSHRNDTGLYDNTSYRYSFDETNVYYTRRSSSDERIEVWRKIPGARVNAEKIYDGYPGFRPEYIDSDDGHVVVGGQVIDGNLTENNDGLFLYIDASASDPTTAIASVISAGQWYYNIEIGYFN